MFTPAATVELKQVTKRFGEFAAVSDLSIAVYPGRVYGLLGPNGAGKTTTLRMIVNITAPDSGSIEIFGKQITPALQDRIGYLPEERGLYKKMKIGEQIKFFAELKSVSNDGLNQRIDSWLDRVKLREWKNKKATELSKGMQQKAQFITAVLHDPELLILDEPFAGLDPINVELLKDIILELKGAGKTIIFSTHQMEVAEKICDDVCLINRSRKIFEGKLREVKRSFGRNAVALRITGGESVLANKSLVSATNNHSDEIEALLVPGADVQELLQELIKSGARVEKFEMIEPSLHDIFITKVTESQ
jgi:ABC-2 type transport system ATP-binding protein